MQNFIAEISGPARFRPGFQTVRQTRGGAVPRLLSFQVNNNLAYLLEFTPGFMRVYLESTKDLITTTVATITGVTKASQGVVTVASATGLSNGQEIILANVLGMAELNNRQVLISDLSGSTFKMKDPVTLAYINTTNFTTYVSGGTASVIYEIATIYGSTDLPNLQIASTRSLAYITTPTQPAQKLTVDANNAFTIGSYSRTNDPFSKTASLNLMWITQGALYDDFESGLGLWTPTLMAATNILGGGTQARSVDTARVTPGFTSASLLAAQATGGAGNWEFDIVKTGSGDVVPDSTGTSFAGTVNAFVRFIPIYNNANNFYELRVYGTDCNTFRLYFNNAGVASLLATFSGSGVANRTSRIKLTRTGAGVWVLYQDGANLGTVTENTLTTSVSAYFYLTTPITIPAGLGSTTNYVGIDNVFFPAGSATAKTLIEFPSGVVPTAGVSYTFSGVVGATTINGGTYKLVAIGGSNIAYLKTVGGADVDSSGWGAYVSGGIAASSPENPIGVAFYEGRLVFAGTDQRPDCLFLSRSPDNNGNSRYDDFTGGSAADFACFFQLAPTGGSTDYIAWARGGPDYLFVGTFGGPYRISGSGLDIPITPSSINVRQFDDAGCQGTMAAGLAQMFFVERSGASVRSIKIINPYLATFESMDLCLNAEQIPAESPIQRIVLAHGRPNVLWAFRGDGVLCGMSVHITVQSADVLTGWHRHKLGGSGLCIDLAILQRATGLDEVWIATQRVLGGVTRCYVELMADDVVFPDLEAFFTGEANRAADIARFNNAVYRLQANYIHVDAAATYDGSARGVTAAATLTPGATTGSAVTFTASQNVFTAQDVGAELWKKPNAKTGVGAGRALITGYTNATTVTCEITNNGVTFDSTAAIAAGDWFFAVKKISGLSHIEGSTPAIVADGAVLTDGGISDDNSFAAFTVTNGVVTLPQNQAVVHVGLPYVGMLETHNLEVGGRSGPAQSKSRTISGMNIRFLNSLGVEFGTNLYNMQKIEQRLSDAVMDRPAPVFSGIRKLAYEDNSSGTDDMNREKNVVVCQRLPLPAVVQFVDIEYETSDESGGRGDA